MYGNPLFRYWWTVERPTEARFLSALFKRLASASGGAARPCSSVESLSQEGTNEVTVSGRLSCGSNCEHLSSSLSVHSLLTCRLRSFNVSRWP